ncbi:MAG: hypothetical protein Q4C04_05785 [Clostridia bacterium]|nr:hypothetical protein [Clostridia bacterium]
MKRFLIILCLVSLILVFAIGCSCDEGRTNPTASPRASTAPSAAPTTIPTSQATSEPSVEPSADSSMQPAESGNP